MPPLTECEVDKAKPFEASELLYRRVDPSEMNSVGEIDPSSLTSISFDKEIEGSPSVLRSLFASPEDAIASECTGGKDASACSVFSIAVGALPGPLTSGDGRNFSFHPVHHPVPTCGAHSVIASYYSNDAAKVYVMPPRSIRNTLRANLAVLMKKTTVATAVVSGGTVQLQKLDRDKKTLG